MDPEGIEGRVANLESQVSELRERVRASEQDAAAARVLAGAADRDVADFGGELRDFRRAAVGSLTALREDLNDLRTEMNDGFIEIRGRLDATAAGQQRIVELIQDLG